MFHRHVKLPKVAVKFTTLQMIVFEIFYFMIFKLQLSKMVFLGLCNWDVVSEDDMFLMHQVQLLIKFEKTFFF